MLKEINTFIFKLRNQSNMESLSDCQIVKEETPHPDFCYKVIIIGDTGVGKSCILYRATTGEFKDQYEVTIGAEYNTIVVRIRGKTVKLQVWDTAGQEGFRSVTRVFYKGAHCAILVYDLTRKDTFLKLGDWLEEVRQNAVADVKMCLVGNQKDKAKERQVETSEGNEFVAKNGLMSFLETSAKTGEGILTQFMLIAKVMFLEHADDETAKLERGYILERMKSVSKKKGCCS